jgi:excinuclease ABC subunit C
MNAAAADLDYERAARLRDDLFALQRVLERNAVVLPDGTDADVVGLASDELEACVRIFHVRDGRIRGERGFIVERVDDADEPQLVATLLGQMYAEPDSDVPRRILVPALPEPGEVAVLTDWLGQQRGGPVGVSVPRRGDKRALMETVTRNASQSLAAHKLRRSGDLTTRSQALTELADALDLPTAPLRIECFDVSNLGADDVVASMVVFEDGLPRPSEYRKFAIKGFHGQNDVAAISEVIGRRFRRLARAEASEGAQEAGTATPVTQDAIRTPDALPSAVATGSVGEPPPPPARFAYPPSLVVIDGGAPQVDAAYQVLVDLGLTDIAVVGLAKRLEEVWLPDEEDPVILPRTSQGLYLLQRVRDEAHRTAIRYQRQKRSARMTTSVLDDIPGLGPARRKALLSRFGSVRKLRAATPEMISEVPGIGPVLAESILRALSGETISAVNLTTGEILGDDVPVTEGFVGDDVPVTEEPR